MELGKPSSTHLFHKLKQVRVQSEELRCECNTYHLHHFLYGLSLIGYILATVSLIISLLQII